MGSYKDTLHLPKTEMPIKADLPANEPAVYKAWDEAKVFNRMKRDGQNPYILHDGPPYANGDIHIGHALNKILKDFAVKFQYFNGRAVEFAPGWDCHGLPIEQKVHAMWRLGGPMRKSDNGRGLTPMSMDEAMVDFTGMCRKYAAGQVSLQMEQFKTLGVLADWDHRYETMSPEYESMISRRLDELANKGFLIRRKKPVYWSWAFQTALAEAEVEYKEKSDESVYLVFPTDGPTFPGGVLVWTTTPWTLPANVAVAINPDLEYVAANVKGFKYPVLVAATLVPTLIGKGIVTGVVPNAKYKGKDFAARVNSNEQFPWKLQHPVNAGQSVPLVMADFVTDQSGTGCVHIAPGHGEDDYQVALKYSLPVVVPVGPDSRYSEGKYGPSEANPDGLWIWEDDSNESLAAKKDGTYKRCSYSTNKVILADLQERGILIHSEWIKHSYPYCSRSDTPVIFRATDQWFLDLDKIRNLQTNPVACLQNVEFYPENSKNRLLPMLGGRPDWCISRQRKWGVQILDSEDILDVWFDSGLSWNVLDGRQADLYLEGNDQHRGWFQSSLWLSAVLAGQSPYKKVVTHGFVVDQNGEKMAKSKGNVVSPSEVVEKLGAEVLRYWVASTDYTKDLQCSQEILKRATEGHKKLRNTFRFLVANMPAEKLEVPKELMPVDAWILTRASQVFAEIHEAFGHQLYYAGIQKLAEFVNGELSGIYMNAVKDRLYCGLSEGRNSSLFVMAEVLKAMLGLVAPLFTYMAQEVFSYMPDWLKGNAKDIFDVTYTPIVVSRPEDLSFWELWKEVLTEFHVAFDRLKTEGKVKDTLEVYVEGGSFFKGAEDWFVVAGVEGYSSREALAEFGGEGMPKFRIVKSDLKKCERCWKRNVDDVNWGDGLCERCRLVVLQAK